MTEAATRDLAVRVSGLSKRYDASEALSGVDLRVRAGEIRGLLGPNGAGKTTLLRALFGLVRPDAGAIELLGSPIQIGRVTSLRSVAGFVEEPAFYPQLSGAANLELLATLDDLDGANIPDALARVGLADRAAARVGGYSTGMRQRLGIAAALLRGPRLLLLDEPTSGLDPAGVRALSALLRELAAAGVAVILSSHRIGELEAICDSYTILDRGRVVWDGGAERVEAEAPASVYALATSDDPRALALAQSWDETSAATSGGGLRLTARPETIDGYVLALARDGVSVRRLEQRVSPLESLFFALTRDGTGSGPSQHDLVATNNTTAPALPALQERPSSSWARVRSVAAVERRKLTSQLPIRALALLTVLGPVVFAVLLNAQNGSPSDALFGAWVHASGFAIPLVVLGFAANWGFPVIAGIVAGDLFSAEDRYGTWKTILTRSRTLQEAFAGKVLAALQLTLVLGTALAIASVVAGVLLVGGQRMVDLSGHVLAPAHLLGLVSLSWLISLLPLIAYMSLAIFFSVVSRNGIVGVLAPIMAALLTQLLDLIGSGVWVHLLLIGSAFDAWHGLFASPAFFGPLVVTLLVCGGWIVASLAAARMVLVRREFVAGAGGARGASGRWQAPLRLAAAGIAGIALLAVGTNLGPAGVTADKLSGGLGPEFRRLVVLQQSLLGHPIPAGSHYRVLPVCGRRTGKQVGPGDWSCTMNVYVLLAGGKQPLSDTPVSYDVSVDSGGCYKAQSPPQLVGQTVIRGSAVNPLVTIYGCVNIL